MLMKFSNYMDKKFGTNWDSTPWGSAIVLAISVPAAIVFSIGVSLDRKLPPSADVVHIALSKVMSNPPSENTVFLWSAQSRQVALNWAHNQSLPKPYFIVND